MENGVALQPAYMSRLIRTKFFWMAVLMTASIAIAVGLLPTAEGRYDGSALGVLDNYAEEKQAHEAALLIDDRNAPYILRYHFTVDGRNYTGSDSTPADPLRDTATVYYVKGDAADNALRQKGSKDVPTLVGGIGLLVGVVASCFLPYFNFREAGALVTARPGIGDSGYEFLHMGERRYGAWAYVFFGFYLQIFLVGFLLYALLGIVHGLSSFVCLRASTAAVLACVIAVWIYFDRWRCVETNCGQFCSGLANFSVLYVPIIAFVYANKRALLKIKGEEVGVRAR